MYGDKLENDAKTFNWQYNQCMVKNVNNKAGFVHSYIDTVTGSLFN